MRLNKTVKTQLDLLDEQTRADARKRELAYPLRIKQKASIPDVEQEKLWARIRVLEELYETWSYQALRRWKTLSIEQLEEASVNWDWFYEERARGLTDYAYIFDQLATFVMHEPGTVRTLHTASPSWYGTEPVHPYRMDCTLLVMKLCYQFWWAKVKGDKQIMNSNKSWDFPLVNDFGEGPYFPGVFEEFGPMQKHMVVCDEDTQLYLVNVENKIFEAELL